jgi:hypothetical protein
VEGVSETPSLGSSLYIFYSISCSFYYELL